LQIGPRQLQLQEHHRPAERYPVSLSGHLRKRSRRGQPEARSGRARAGRLGSVPPVLTFQSVVDFTVSTPASPQPYRFTAVVNASADSDATLERSIPVRLEALLSTFLPDDLESRPFAGL
jgi:hypothetical protein